MTVRRWLLALVFVLILVLGGLIVTVYVTEPEYAYIPSPAHVLNTSRNAPPAFDVWGQPVSQEEATQLQQTADGRARLSPQNGAVVIDESVLRLGREAFYRETFGNEVFLTDIMGILNGPLTPWRMARTLWKLGGRGTTNLQIDLDEDVTVGGVTFPKGTALSTGLDVTPGSYLPLGIKVKFTGGRIAMGITCALCHATLDPSTMKVIEGGMNTDVRGGLLLALAANSTAYLGHADVPALAPYATDPQRTVMTADGKTVRLPDPAALEEAVDAGLMKWPPGTFDATTDLVGNPTKINNTFTLGDHPYAWTGVFPAGPFNGLAAITSHVHAIGSDGLSQAASSPFLMGLDTEVYLGTVLQNATLATYRYDPKSGQRPSEFFASVDPTPGTPGSNQIVALPTFPNTSLMSEVGLVGSSPSYRFLEQNNALAAFQNTLVPPTAPLPANADLSAHGRAIFAQARCATCHAGPELTNHRIIPVTEIGTEPSRAKALQTTEGYYVPPIVYAFDTPVPVPQDARVVPVPTDRLDPEQIRLSLAYGGLSGGYKVPSLIGLYWNAPYLHDGGVAVGPDAYTHLGMAGTLMRGIRVDPANSLRALVDKELRQKVVAANEAVGLASVHVRGGGHEFWVDSSAGFTTKDQDALVHYLLTLDPQQGKGQTQPMTGD